MHTFNRRQFTIFHHGDYAGDAEIVNQITGEKMEVPTDLLFCFVSSAIRMDRISRLEQAGTDDILGISHRHPVFVNRRDFVESKKNKHIFWCTAGTKFEEERSSKDGWYHWDEVGVQHFGPYDTEDLAIEACNRYAEHINADSTNPHSME